MSPSGAEVLRQIKSRIDEVDPAAVREQVGNGAVVVDVREPEEWGAGHIPGAVAIVGSWFSGNSWPEPAGMARSIASPRTTRTVASARVEKGVRMGKRSL